MVPESHSNVQETKATKEHFAAVASWHVVACFAANICALHLQYTLLQPSQIVFQRQMSATGDCRRVADMPSDIHKNLTVLPKSSATTVSNLGTSSMPWRLSSRSWMLLPHLQMWVNQSSLPETIAKCRQARDPICARSPPEDGNMPPVLNGDEVGSLPVRGNGTALWT